MELDSEAYVFSMIKTTQQKSFGNDIRRKNNKILISVVPLVDL